MTQDNNFAGRNDYVWFTGVIEGRDDPLKMGRLRVRIIGLHTDDTNIVPTEDLPWAQIVLPINGSRNFSVPKDGEWVMGFFQDGHNSQIPVITGVYPGINSQEPKVDDGSVAKIATLERELTTLKSTLLTMTATGGQSPTAQRQIQQQKQKIADVEKQIADLKQNVDSKPQRGFVDRRSKREVSQSPNPPAGVVIEKKNEPSINPIAREIIAATGIELSNNDRAHACDFAIYVRRSMAAAKFYTSQVAVAIREGIKKLLQGLGSSPSTGGFASTIRSLAQYVKRLTKWINDINAMVDVFITYVRKIRAVIEYILSLPAQLLARFKSCLSEAYAELAAGFMAIASDFTLTSESGGLSDAATAAKELFTATKELAVASAKVVAAPAAIIGAVSNPSSLTPEEQKAIVQGLFPDSSSFDKTQYASSTV